MWVLFIVSNNSLIIILKLFRLQCVTFPPISQQSAQDVGYTASCFFLLWVVAAPSNIFLNKVGVGVPGVCSAKGRIFFLLFLHIFLWGASAFCSHYHACETGVCFCAFASAGDKTRGFWHLGMPCLSVAAGRAFPLAVVAALSCAKPQWSKWRSLESRAMQKQSCLAVAGLHVP